MKKIAVLFLLTCASALPTHSSAQVSGPAATGAAGSQFSNSPASSPAAGPLTHHSQPTAPSTGAETAPRDAREHSPGKHSD